jgi:hypothetical protein
MIGDLGRLSSLLSVGFICRIEGVEVYGDGYVLQDVVTRLG